MPFSDPAGGFYSPSMPNTGPIDSGHLSLAPLPNIENINPPSAQPFRNIQPVEYSPDNTPAVAIKVGAETFQTAVSAADNVLKYNAEKETKSQIDTFRNSQLQSGVDLKQKILEDTQSQESRDQPVGLSQGISRMTTVDKARRSGVLADEPFYARLQEIVSSMKNKYPGYSDVIDAKAKEVTGVDLADARRKALQADVTQLRQDQIASQGRYDKFIQENGDILGKLGYDYRTASFNQLQYDVTRVRSIEHAYDTEAKQLALKQSQGTAISNDTAGYALSLGTMNLASKMQSYVGQIEKGANGRSFQDVLTNGINDKDQLQAITGTMSQMKIAANRDIDAMFNTSLSPLSDPGNTMMRQLTAGGNVGKLDEVRNQILKPITELENAIVNKDTGAAGAVARRLQFINDKTQADLAQKYPGLWDLTAISQKAGPAFSDYLFSQQGVKNYMGGIVQDALRMDNLKSDKPASDQIKTAQSNPSANFQSGNWNTFINDKVMSITTSQDKDMKTNSAKSLFMDHDPGYFLLQVPAEQRMGALNVIASPTVAAEVGKMSPEIQQGYSNWVLTNFPNASKRLGDEIAYQNTGSPYYDVKFDPNTGHFIPVPTTEGMKNPKAMNSSIMAVKPSLVSLNSGIDIVKPVVEKQGQDFNTYISGVAQGLGISPDQMSKDEKRMSINRMESQQIPLTQYSGRLNTPQDQIKNNPSPLHDFIIKAENGGLNYNKSNFGGDIGASDKTVGDILEMQHNHLITGGKGSTAVGGGQFLYETLKGLVDTNKINPNTKFTPELQDTLMTQLMNKRGLPDYQAGKLSESDFADNLAKEWASLPEANGKSHYEGDKAGNRALVKRSDLIATIRKMALHPSTFDVSSQ